MYRLLIAAAIFLATTAAQAQIQPGNGGGSAGGGGGVIAPIIANNLLAATNTTQAGDAANCPQGYCNAPVGIVGSSNIAFSGTAIITLGSVTGGSGYTQNASILALGAITAGSSYVQGTYNSVPLTGGTGSGAQAQIIVGSGGTVVKVVLTARGTGYTAADSLSASNANLGGAGSGFAIPVSSVGQIYAGVALTGGSGTGAAANITVNSAGAVSAVGLTNRGTGYANTDTLSATVAGGSGFSVPVSTVGATGGPPFDWFSVYGKTISGNLPIADATGTYSPLQFYIGNDTMTGVGMAVMQVEDGLGTGFAGGRIGVQGKIVVNGVPSTTPNTGLTGVTGQTTLNSNLLGATGAYSNYLGTGFGGNSQIIATQNATFISIVNGHEFDVECQLGCTTAEKHAATFVATAGDAVQAIYDDSAVEFSDQDQANFVGWTTVLQFGGYAHKSPVSTTGTLIGIQNRVVPSPATVSAAIGVDMSNGSFSTAQYKGVNWLVDGSGNQFVGRTTVLTIGDSLSVFKSNNGPGGMTVDNNNGGTATYTMINLGNGNATTEAQIRLNGSSFSGGLGANGFSIGVTASGAAMEIGTGSETLQLGSSGMFTADATTTACVGVLGPAGIHATVQKWLTIKDNGGTVGYIPVC